MSRLEPNYGQFLQQQLQSPLRQSSDPASKSKPWKPAAPRTRRARVNGIDQIVSTQTSIPQLILASRSPRRQHLLREAGYEFTVAAPSVNEEDFPRNLQPSELALYLARMKARAVAEQHPQDVVLAADTVVVMGDRILGKPSGEAHARRMLQLLAGGTHIVITGVAIAHLASRSTQEKRVMTAVRMRALSTKDIDRYIDTALWEGKAGAYGLQDGNPFIKGVVGCVTNVVGLPMSTTRAMLSSVGIHPTRGTTS